MSLLDDLEALRAEAAAAFAAASDASALEVARVDFLGNRGRLKKLLGRMGEIPREQKPAVGKRVNEISAEIQALFDTAKARVAPSPYPLPGERGTTSAAPAPVTATSLEALRQERLGKLKLYEGRMGKGSAFGARFPDPKSEQSLVPIEEIRRKFGPLDPARHTDPKASTMEVCLAARVMLRREQSKKLIFLTVQDQTGSIQVGLWNATLNEETLALLRDTLDLWDIVGVTGKLAFTQKGEPTVWATSAKLLSKCLAPPPDKHHGIHDKELRYRQRYLDLISTPESRRIFILRSKAIAALRRFLDEQGFLEMETPVLQTIPGGAAARPFETKLNALDMKMYLRIATEIPLKKLLVGGLERVYELGRIFRNEGIDSRHNPEFTTVELYQAYGDLRDMMALTENAVSGLAQSLTGSTTVTWRGKPVKLGAPWPRLDYCGLLRQHAGVSHDDIPGLDRKLREKGIDPMGLSQVDKIDGVFGEYAEPHLWDACFVINQPVEMSPLCRAHPGNPGLADRFEAFAGNMEIANSYTELNDPAEQRARFCAQLRESWIKVLKEILDEPMDMDDLHASHLEKIGTLIGDIQDDADWQPEASPRARALVEELRARLGGWKRAHYFRAQLDKLADPSNVIDADFLAALEHGMPPAGGLGIGVDRVIMLLANADSIRDAILFPLMRPENA